MQHNQDVSAKINREIEDGEETSHRYLVYALAGEHYASPLASVREVLKVAEVKEVPYMKNYFKGIINLRGQIISVIDLREKLALQGKPSGSGLILVVETKHGSLAAIVDDVVSVSHIPEQDIDRQPVLSTKIPVDFFLGIAKTENRLLNLIDISGTVSSDDFATIKRAKEVA